MPSSMEVDSSTRPAFFDELLIHLPKYQVLICKQCQFAIQPSAINTHLKQQHQIYRQNRQRLLEYISSLDLAEPASVHNPQPTSPPIDSLPVLPGFRCRHDACEFSCASIKRMKSHWTIQHGRPGSPDSDWRDAVLQTFFRGTQLRYFEVQAAAASYIMTPPEDSNQPPVPNPNNPSNEPFHSALHPQHLTPLHSPTTTDPPNLDAASSPCNSNQPTTETLAQFTINDLSLYTHFLQHTAATLFRGSEPLEFWNATVPAMALANPWLMHCLMSFAATHLAQLRPCSAARYTADALRHQTISLPTFRAALIAGRIEDIPALTVYARLFAYQNIHTYLQRRAGDANNLPINPLCNDSGERPIVSLLRLMRGGCELTLSLLRSPTARKSPTAQALLPPDAADLRVPPLDWIVEERLERLSTRLCAAFPEYTDYNAVETGGTISREACIQARRRQQRTSLDPARPMFRALCTSFALSMGLASPSRAWDGMEAWTATLKDDVLDIMAAGNKPALVVLAHWAILVGMVEKKGVWYLEGVAKLLYEEIRDELGEEGGPLLEWVQMELYD